MKITHVKKLPIKELPIKEQKDLSDTVDKIINSDPDDSKLRDECEAYINEKVYEIYDVDKDEQMLIENSM